MPIKLQTKHAHRRLTPITVNGNTYDIDKDGCIIIADEDAADAKKLLSLGDEWTSKVRTGVMTSAVSRVPQPGQPMRNAVQFVELLQTDSELADKVASLRSWASLRSLAQNLNFRFDENEYKAALSALAETAKRSQAIDEANAAKLAETEEDEQPEEQPEAKEEAPSSSKRAKADAGKGSGAKQPKKSDKPAKQPKKSDKPAVEKAGTEYDDSALPDVLPEETSGDWPDPEESMGMNYLKRMAAAYKVKYAANIDKATLIENIQQAMYSEE